MQPMPSRENRPSEINMGNTQPVPIAGKHVTGTRRGKTFQPVPIAGKHATAANRGKHVTGAKSGKTQTGANHGKNL